MARHDAYLCDVIIIPTEQAARDLDALALSLGQAGLDVREVLKDQCVIEGTIDAGHVRHMEELPGVEYVRTVFSYIADFPDDDPRNVPDAKPN